MTIASTDIEYRLSGGAANTNKQLALGGAMSTAGGGVITPGAANNLWDDVTGDESAAGDTEYRCIYVKNAHATLTLLGAVAWVDSDPAGGAVEAIGLDSAAVNATAASTSADENTAPTGGTPPSFSSPTTKATGLAIGDIPPGQFKAIWVRRTVAPGTSAVAETLSLRVEGDSLP